MERLALLIVVFVILAALLVLSRRRARSDHDAPVVYERRHLFTAVERSFLGVLDQATGDRVRVFGRVRLDDLLAVPQQVADGARRAARQKLASEHVDFVVCEAADLRVLAVVELEDARQDGDRRVERNAFVDGSLAAAGIEVLRFAARPGYTVDEVRRRLGPVLPGVTPAAASARHRKPGKGGAAGRGQVPVGRPAADKGTSQMVSDIPPEGAAETVPTPATVVADRPAATGSTARPAHAGSELGQVARLGSCPTCGRPMVERIGKRGALKGKPYLVCSGEPPCSPMVANG